MIPKECKRLAEVDFPIAVVSKHAAREKSIRHGHPSTLHLWWARRPLAACRAMLLALLWPDPCDLNCPQDFKDRARELLAPLPGKVGKTDEDLRKALLKFIGDFADWDRSADKLYLEVSRALVKVAHGDEPPLVVDPFAGGGSIPLEALRVGCDAFASDLNPVACLILKVMLEDIPRWGGQAIKVKSQNGEEVEANGLAEALKIVGKDIKDSAEKELKEFYPDDPDGAKPIAYLWARTVRCEAPNCGAEIPLRRSFWLCKKPNRKRALRYQVIRTDDEPSKVEFEIFEPKTDKDVPNGTVRQAKANCLCCNTILSPDRVRWQLARQRGGSDVIFDKHGQRVGGAKLLSVVVVKSDKQGRYYRLPMEHDYRAVYLAQQAIPDLPKILIPNEPLPSPSYEGHDDNSAYFNFMPLRLYGFENWGDLFSTRPKMALAKLAGKVRELQIERHDSVSTMCTLAIGRTADQMSSLVRWLDTIEAVASTFGRQALPIVWDFVEIIPTGDKGANFIGAIEWIIKVIEALSLAKMNLGECEQANAMTSPLPDDSCNVWFTDPPYYDAVPYAYLSDFFFVWFKRILPDYPLFRDPFDAGNPLTPKRFEIIEDLQLLRGVPKESARNMGYVVKDRAFFENSITHTFAEGTRVLRADGIGCIVFAHKTTEGWEALLSGMLRAGMVITASWPITTERGVRMRARDSAALSASVHLVCRPRPEDAPVGDWGDVLKELPTRVGDWMERLQSEGIRGADLVFACIGPALEIFSRYSKVETAEGQEITLAQYLEKVWEVVGRIALEHVLGTAEAKARNGAAGAIEEDARLTALFLWTLQSTNGEAVGNGKDMPAEEDEDGDDEEESGAKAKPKGFSLIFDVVRRFAQPLGIHLPEWEGRIIETKKGIVRLFSVGERAEQLFGKEGTQSAADRMEEAPVGKLQMLLFPELEAQMSPKVKGRGVARQKINLPGISDDAFRTKYEATTLDRVHAAMLLQAGGRSNALRALIKEEIDRGGEFLRLANALSALYPKTSEEKRLVDAMLLAVPR